MTRNTYEQEALASPGDSVCGIIGWLSQEQQTLTPRGQSVLC